TYLEHPMQVEIISTQSREGVAALIAELASDDRVDVLNDVPEEIVEDILSRVPAVERRDILRLQAYPEGTAGSIMTTDVAKLAETLTVREALDELSRQAGDLETIYYLYIVDEGDHLRGLVSARQLVTNINKPGRRLSDLMETELVACNARDDQEEVAQKVARYDLLAIPVLDDERRMLGIITHDDVIDVFHEEAAEDVQRLGGMEPLEMSYMHTPILTLSWKRGMWLIILFFGALLTAFALDQYEGRLATFPWLVIFIPLVISSGGNSGNQSATLIITGLTSGEIKVSDWVRVLGRELLIGLILGGFLALCGIMSAWFLADEAKSLKPALILPVTLLLVVIAGALSGALLPLFFKRLGLDPAMMSNPFVAGIVDILGIVIYMNVALALLQ
ncbi:MAG: magnesium transporter, partial [Planctomycetes bacterium]|nr:magnesium transporter [Planctomycetota bacterium]